MPKIVDRDAMQEKILAAAWTVFRAEGVHAATMARIAREAGLAKGTVYLYFASKDALTAALLRAHFARVAGHFASLPAPASRAELLDMLDDAFGDASGQAQSLRLFVEVFGPGFSEPAVRREIADVFDRLATVLAGHLAAVATLDDPQALARGLVAMLDGLLLHAALFPSALADPGGLRREFRALVAARLGA